MHDNIEGIRGDVVAATVARYVAPDSIDDQWDLPGLEAALREEFSLDVPIVKAVADDPEMDAEAIAARVHRAVAEQAETRQQQVGEDNMRLLEKHIMLNVLDQNWKEHLARMDFLRQGIHLRGYAQKQPKQEYKREAFELFSEMLDKVKREVTQLLARVRIRSEDEIAQLEAEDRQRMEAQANRMQFQHPDMGSLGAGEEVDEMQADPALAGGRIGPKIGRNDPCPCGSGKKYKQCHGQLV